MRSLLLLSALLFCCAFAGQAVAAERNAGYKRTAANYEMPDVTLVNQDGKKVRLHDVVNSGKPVIVDFIYCTCTTLCPMQSANFTNFQERIGPEHEKVQLLSISIDPEHDSPKLMKEHLKRFGAKAGWSFLTGAKRDIEKVLKAFNALSQDKMYHYPLIVLKSPVSGQWVRIEGLIGTTLLVEEYRKILKG